MDPRAYARPVTRLVALLLACLFLAIAVAGMFLPVVPTVPFLLLAAWFSARGSKRLHRWIYEHPRLGKLLIDWEQQGAISRRSKVVAVSMLAVSGIVMCRHLGGGWALAGVTVLFLAVIAFLLSRPEPR